MKREILDVRPNVGGCCPGHDDFADDSYENNRSKRTRARMKKAEHRLVRRVKKMKSKR